MKRVFDVLLVSMLTALSLPAADAGPLLDALRGGRARDAQGQEARDGPTAELLDAGEGGAAAPLPPGARKEADVAYGPDPAQRLDVYLPPNVPKNAPILLMIHGGAWMLGDKANSGVVAGKLAHWLPRGYVVVSANYRMARPPRPLAQADDVGRALAFVQEHAGSWGADPSRLILMGHSSGAHLVALLAADPAIARRQGARAWAGSVLLDSAALDVGALMAERHPRFYDRVFGAEPARWAEASPLQRLATRPAPIFLVCSSRRSDSCPAARAFAAKATALGGRANVLPVDLSHGETNATLGHASAYTSAVDDFLHAIGLP